MLNTYFTTRKIAEHLHETLEKSILTQCFSTNNNEICVEFDTENGLQWLKMTVAGSNVFCTLQARNAELPKQRLTQFWEINGAEVQGVLAHFGERSFEINLSNNQSLIFKLYGKAANVIYYKDQLPYQAFMRQRTQDLDIEKAQPFEKDKVVSIDIFNKINCIFELKKTVPYLNNLYIINYLQQSRFDDIPHQQEKNILLENLYNYLLNPDFYIYDTAEGLVFTLFENENETPIIQSSSAMEVISFFAHKFLSINRISEIKNDVTKQIDSQIYKHKKTIENLQIALKNIQAATPKNHIADILMANLHQIAAGSDSVVLDNFYDENKPINIVLKPQLSAQKNAERYYKKSKNEHLEIANIEKKMEECAQKLVELNEKRQITSQTTRIKSLHAQQQTNAKTDPNTHLPYRLFMHNNTQIWVGKSAESNDEILRLAHKNDTWLHARGVAGSHVLVRHANQPLQKNTLQIAANLAAYYSKGKTQKICPVIFTPRKFVRKPKGAAAGAVLLEKEQVIMATPTAPSDL
jgi:predicted ribosome quality control (RQC) complex YloA/Tae2 family protein